MKRTEIGIKENDSSKRIEQNTEPKGGKEY